MEEIKKLLKAIHRTAEIVREHLETRAYRNHLTTVVENDTSVRQLGVVSTLFTRCFL